MNQTEADLIYLFNRYTMTEKFSNRLQVIVNRWTAKSLMQSVSVDGGTESSSKIVNFKKKDGNLAHPPTLFQLNL